MRRENSNCEIGHSAPEGIELLKSLSTGVTYLAVGIFILTFPILLWGSITLYAGPQNGCEPNSCKSFVILGLFGLFATLLTLLAKYRIKRKIQLIRQMYLPTPPPYPPHPLYPPSCIQQPPSSPPKYQSSNDDSLPLLAP